MKKSVCVKHYHSEEKYCVSFGWNVLNFSNGEDHCFKENITACNIYSRLTIESQCFVTNSLSKRVVYAQAELKSQLIVRV